MTYLVCRKTRGGVAVVKKLAFFAICFAYLEWDRDGAGRENGHRQRPEGIG